MQKHIAHLKRHRNVLYGIVFILLLLQIVSFIVVSSQTAKIVASQQKTRIDLGDKVEVLRQENQVSIEEIVRYISQQREDLDQRIDLLKDSQNDFSGVINQVIPGVVSIRTDKAVGTGFLITSDGYIITNYHVVGGGSFAKVSTYDGKELDAQYLGIDPFMDLALLKVPGNFHYLELADSEETQIGEKVIAIGNPLGLSFSVTQGIVSAVKRLGPNGLNTYIQTDVTLNPGNSGGPLIDSSGKVIGVNNFKVGGAESLGFALESNVIREQVNNLTGQNLIQ